MRTTACACVHMFTVMTNDVVMRLTKLGERERVCRRAVKDKVNVAIGLEQVADELAGACGPLVVAIRQCGINVRRFQHCPGFRANPGGVVTGKIGASRASVHVATCYANWLCAAERTDSTT